MVFGALVGVAARVAAPVVTKIAPKAIPAVSRAIASVPASITRFMSGTGTATATVAKTATPTIQQTLKKALTIPTVAAGAAASIGGDPVLAGSSVGGLVAGPIGFVAGGLSGLAVKGVRQAFTPEPKKGKPTMSWAPSTRSESPESTPQPTPSTSPAISQSESGIDPNLETMPAARDTAEQTTSTLKKQVDSAVQNIKDSELLGPALGTVVGIGATLAGQKLLESVEERGGISGIISNETKAKTPSGRRARPSRRVSRRGRKRGVAKPRRETRGFRTFRTRDGRVVRIPLKKKRLTKQQKEYRDPVGPGRTFGTEAQYRKKGGKAVKYTKNGQPYIILESGKARFLKKSEVKRR